MSGLVQGLMLREVMFGLQVTEPAKNLPQTGTGNIFNVNNGRVILTSLIGQVTTAIGATATTLSVGVAPTGGTASTTVLATAGTITSLALGSLVAVPVTAGALIVGGNGTGVVAPPGASLINSAGIAIISPGFITITTSANDTGQIQWTLGYVPFDAGANVTAV